MPLRYKIYTMILAERLEEEMAGKGILSGNQAGFRKSMRTMDQIYTLNNLVNRQIDKEKENMMALFINLKTAFDSTDKEVLIRTMRESEIREGLVEKGSLEGNKRAE